MGKIQQVPVQKMLCTWRKKKQRQNGSLKEGKIA